jgi:hypothetical protein
MRQFALILSLAVLTGLSGCLRPVCRPPQEAPLAEPQGTAECSFWQRTDERAAQALERAASLRQKAMNRTEDALSSPVVTAVAYTVGIGGFFVAVGCGHASLGGLSIPASSAP